MKGIHNRKNIQRINRLLAVLLILAMIMKSLPVSPIIIHVRAASNSDSVRAVTQSEITTQDYSDLISIPDAWREVNYPDSSNEIEIKKENRWIILNGQAVIVQMHGDKSALYLDKNANGVVDAGTDLLIAEDGDEILGEGSRLASYIIYGGRYSTMDRDICITVNSGNVGDIYGCFQCRTSGDVRIQLNGGNVGSVYGVYAGNARNVNIYSNAKTGDITGLSGGCARGSLLVQLGQSAAANQVIGVDAATIQSPNVNCCVTGNIEVKLLDNASCSLLSGAEVYSNVELQAGGNVQVAITSLKGAQNIHGAVAKSPSVVIGGSVIVDTVFCNFYELKLAQLCKQITGDVCLTVKYDGDSSENISGSIYGAVTSNVYRNVNIYIQNDKNMHSLYAVSQGAVIYGDADMVLQDAVVNLMEGISQSVVYGDIRQRHSKVKALRNVYFITKAQAGGNIAVDMEGSEYCGYLVPMGQCQIAGDVDISSHNCTIYGMLSETNVVEGSETILYENSTMTGQSVDALVSDTISGDLTITLEGWQNGWYLTPVKTDARIMGNSEITISNSEIINAVSYEGTVLGDSTVTLANCIAGELRFSGTVRLTEKLTIDEGYYGEIGKYNVVYGDNNISILGGTFNKNIQFGAGNNSYDGAAGDIQMEIEEGIFNGSTAFVGNTNSPHNQVTIKVADSEKVVIEAGVTIGLKKDSDTQLEGGMLNNKGEVIFEGQYVCEEELNAKTVAILPDSSMILKNDIKVSHSFANAGKLYVNTAIVNIPEDSEKGAVYYPLDLQCDKAICNPYGDGLDYLNTRYETGYYALVTDNNRIVPNPKKGYTVGQILFKRDTMQEFEQLKVDEEGGFSFAMEETPAQLQIVVELKQLEGTQEVIIDDNEKVIDLAGHSVVLMSGEKGTGIYEDQNQDGVADTTVPICEGDYEKYTMYGVKDASYDKGVSITVLGGQLQRICGSQNAIIRNPGACVISINMQAGKVDTITASEESELEGRICLVQATDEKVDVSLGEADVSGTYLDNQGEITIAGDYPLAGTIEGRSITLAETLHQTVEQSCSLIASDSITVNGELTVKGLLQTRELINQKGTIYHQGMIEAEEYVCSWDGTKTGCLFIQGGTVSGSDWKGVLYPIDCSDYNAEEMNLDYIHSAYRNGIALDSEEGTTYYGRAGYSQMCRYEALEGYELQDFFSEEAELTHDDNYLYWTMPMKEVHIKGICQPKQIVIKENFNTPLLELGKQYTATNPAVSLSQWLTRVDDAKGNKATYKLVQGQELPEGLSMDTLGRIYGTPEKEYSSGKSVDIEITGNNGTKVTYSFVIIVKKQLEDMIPLKDRISVGKDCVQLNGVSVVIRGDENNNYIYADDDRDGLADTPECVKVAQYYKTGYRYSYYGWYRQNAVGDIRITVEDGSVGNLTGAYDSTIDGEIEIYIGKKGFCARVTGYSLGKVSGGYKITERNQVTVGGSYAFAEETVLDEKTRLVVNSGAKVTINKDVLLKLFCGYTDSFTNKGELINDGTLEIAGSMENNHTLTNNGSVFAKNIVNNGTVYNWGSLEYEASIQNNAAVSRIYTKESLLHLKKPVSVPNTYYPMELYDCNEGGSSIFYQNAVNLGSDDKPSYYGKAGEQVQIRCTLDSQAVISLTATKITKGNGESLSISKVSEDKIAFTMPDETVTAAVCYESDGIQLSAYEARNSEGRVGVAYVPGAPLFDMQSITIQQDEGEGMVSYNVSTLENNTLPAGLELTQDGKLIGTPKSAVQNVSTLITVTGRNGTTARFLLKLSIQKGVPVLTLEDQEKDYTGTAQTLEYTLANVAASYNRSLITMNYYKKETGEQIQGEPVEPGKYLVVAKAKADADYEEAVSNTALLTINRAFAEKDIIALNYKKTYDGKAIVPEVTVKQDADVTYSEDQLSYSAEAPAYRDAGSYRLYYRLQKEGYKDWNSYIQITIDKALPTISVVPEYEWTGQAVALEYRVSGVDKELDKKNCRVAYYSSDSDEALKEVPREEGSYQVEIWYNGTANYKSVSKKEDICIAKNLAEKNQQAVDEVEQLIDEIGSVSYDTACKERIERASVRYDALTPTQKAIVSKSALLNLQLAKELYDELEEEALREEQEYQNQQAAERVIDMIYAMPKPDGSAQIDIQLKSIQLAYEGLSEEQKQLIPARDWKYYERQAEKQKEIKKEMEAGTTKEQSTTEKPVSSETSSSSEVSTSSETPSSSERPSSSEIPSSSEQPSSSETPSSSEQPSGSETPPSSSEQSSSSEAPAGGEPSTGNEAAANNNMQSSGGEKSSGNEVADTSVLPSEQETGISQIKQKGILYKVISEKGNKGTVAVQGMYKKNKKTVVIPATVRYKEKTYRVVQIAAGCFNKKKKLKKITIKSPYIKKIGKKAFGGLPAKVKIKVPKKQRKKYSKYIRKSGYKGTIV